MMDWLKKVAAQLGTDLEALEKDEAPHQGMGFGSDSMFSMGPDYEQAMKAAGLMDEGDDEDYIPQGVSIFDGGFDMPLPAAPAEEAPGEMPHSLGYRLNQLEQLREVEEMMARYSAESEEGD